MPPKRYGIEHQPQNMQLYTTTIKFAVPFPHASRPWPFLCSLRRVLPPLSTHFTTTITVRQKKPGRSPCTGAAGAQVRLGGLVFTVCILLVLLYAVLSIKYPMLFLTPKVYLACSEIRSLQTNSSRPSSKGNVMVHSFIYGQRARIAFSKSSTRILVSRSKIKR